MTREAAITVSPAEVAEEAREAKAREEKWAAESRARWVKKPVEVASAPPPAPAPEPEPELIPTKTDAPRPTEGEEILTIPAKCIVRKHDAKHYTIAVFMDNDYLTSVKVVTRGPWKRWIPWITEGNLHRRNYESGVATAKKPRDDPRPLKPTPHSGETEEEFEKRQEENEDAKWNWGAIAYCFRKNGLACDLEPRFEMHTNGYNEPGAYSATGDLHEHLKRHGRIFPEKKVDKRTRGYKHRNRY